MEISMNVGSLSCRLIAGLIAMTSFATLEASARERVRDQRGVPRVVGHAPNPPSHAIPGGWRGACVSPFCRPTINAGRSQVSDHRTWHHGPGRR